MPHSPSLLEPASQLVDTLRERKLTVAVAESCTGGMLSAAITEVPGASDVFECGFVTYANSAKTNLVGVPADLIESKGAVSEEVARAMAEGVFENSTADIAAAITGIAGPDGGSAQKPVGLVYIAVARRGTPSIAHRHIFPDNGRAGIRQASAEASLKALSDLVKTSARS